MQLPAQYRLDVTTATDEQIVDDMAQLIAQYMYGLLFKQDENGRYYASPYDVFLRINHLPHAAACGRDRAAIQPAISTSSCMALSNPNYVDGTYGRFQYHAQPFAFGATELAGLKIFLASASGATDGSQHAGNCAACHVAPNFTDFRFHNTGVAQEEYDAANGSGAFAALAIPALAAAQRRITTRICPSRRLIPNATERFRHPAVPGSPQFADLGLWNMYLNPDIPNPQANLDVDRLRESPRIARSIRDWPRTIAQFKTPTLRDLEDSAPYFHNGSKLTFTDVVKFYINSSQLARQGLLRNPPPEFQTMSISQGDVAALAAFLHLSPKTTTTRRSRLEVHAMRARSSPRERQIVRLKIPATMNSWSWPATQVTLRKPIEPTLDPRVPASSCPCACPGRLAGCGKA